MRTSIFSTWVK